jgi:YfiH family protein
MELIRDDRYGTPILRRKQVIDNPEMEILTFPKLEQEEQICHFFTTRLGGVSEGIYKSMNLSFSRGDDPTCVTENYRRVAHVLGCDLDDMICTKQTHTTNIRRITGEDRGTDGTIRPSLFEDVDGLITDTPKLALSAFYADCVPLLFWDPVHKAIGLAHSGWRGTAGRIGKSVVEQMGEAFGSRPKDILAGIGPSICGDCYEVGEEVADAIGRAVGEETAMIDGILKTLTLKPSKYKLDLWKANERILHQAGLLPEHIEITDICTCHNPNYLFSHRASGGRRGNFGAFMMIKD